MLRRNILWFLIVPAAMAATYLDPGTAAAARPKFTTHSVVIEAMRFEPQEVTLKVGDTVVWTNHDPFPHTVTAVGRQFDSHEIATRSSWKYTATKPGNFAYACSLHPAMLGTLRVE